jgi:hypothetical protein
MRIEDIRHWPLIAQVIAAPLIAVFAIGIGLVWAVAIYLRLAIELVAIAAERLGVTDALEA